MGVHGLWQLLHSAGKPITLESLEGKVLAVDVSIWLNKAAKGMRDKLGNPVYNAHLILIFHRLCKLLFYNIKPVFVFDGGVPELKKRTLAVRRDRKMRALGMANKASQKMVHNYLKGKALEAVTGQRGPKPVKLSRNPDQDIFKLPPMPVINQAESSSDEEIVDADTEWMAGMKSDEVERMFENIGSVDFESEEFKALPPEIQHELLTEMKDSYRRRYNKKKSQPMPEEAQDFSDFQLKNLFRRGKITKTIDDVRKTMNSRSSGQIVDLDEESYFSKNIKSIEAKKVASEDKQHYILMKKSGKKGGENILFNADLEVDKIDIYKQTRKNEDFDRLERDPAKFKEAFIDSWTSISFISDSSDESDSDYDKDDDDNEISFRKPSELSGKGNLTEPLYLDTVKLSAKEDDRDLDDRVRTDYNISRDDTTDFVVEVFDQNLDRHLEQDETVVKKRKIEDNGSVDAVNAINEPNANVLDLGQKISDTTPSAGRDSGESDVSIEPAKAKILEPQVQITKDSVPKESPVGVGFEEETESSVTKDTELANDTSICLKDLENEDNLRTSGKLGKAFITEAPQSIDEEVSADDGDVSAIPKNVRERSITDDFVQFDNEDTLQFKRDVQGQSLEELSEMQNTIQREQENLQREREKQTRAAASVGNEEYRDVQELLRLFGIPFVISPMEAEAQCAILDMTNQTDGSVSDDSDIFLFGATRVFKNIFNQEKYAEMYTKENINHILNLNREKMIAIAFLSGSDYTEGIQGVGSITAMEILQEFGGDALQPLIRLREWFDDIKQYNQYGCVEQKTKLKTKLLSLELPKGFPSDKVWEAYISPTVDNSEEPFEWGRPDLAAIREFAREKFGWNNARTDEILLPVVKNLNTRKDQKSIEKYFLPSNTPHSVHIESKRLKRVVNLMRSGVTNDNTKASYENTRNSQSESRPANSRTSRAKSASKSKSVYFPPKGSIIKPRIPTAEQFQKRVQKSRAGSRGRPRRPTMPFSVRSSKLPSKDSGADSKLCLSESSSDSDA